MSAIRRAGSEAGVVSWTQATGGEDHAGDPNLGILELHLLEVLARGSGFRRESSLQGVEVLRLGLELDAQEVARERGRVFDFVDLRESRERPEAARFGGRSRRRAVGRADVFETPGPPSLR